MSHQKLLDGLEEALGLRSARASAAADSAN